jgi:hypothetical protein
MFKDTIPVCSILWVKTYEPALVDQGAVYRCLRPSPRCLCRATVFGIEHVFRLWFRLRMDNLKSEFVMAILDHGCQDLMARLRRWLGLAFLSVGCEIDRFTVKLRGAMA